MDPASLAGRLRDELKDAPVLGAGLAAVAGFVLAGVVVRKPLLAVVILGAAAAGAFTVRFPRAALVLVAGLLLGEGALRKWFLPQVQEALYFAKDGIVAVLLVYWLLTAGKPLHGQRLRPLPNGVLVLAALVVGYMVLEIFNPRNPSLVLYVFGLRTYLLPLGLLAVVPWLLTWPEFRRLFRGLVLALIPLGLLALVQSQLPAEHLLNRYVGWQEHHVATFGSEGLVRVTATFSFISGFTGYLTVAMLGAPAALTGRGRPVWLALLVLGLGTLSILLSGSRWPLVIVALGLPVVAYPLWRAYGGEALIRLAMGALALGLVLGNAFEEPLEQYAYRATTAGDTAERARKVVQAPLVGMAIGGAFGWGPGTTHQSREQLLNRVGEWGRLPGSPEVESGRIMVELGAVGGVLWYALRVAMVVMLLGWTRKAYRRGSPQGQMFVAGAAVIGAVSVLTSMVLNVYLYYLWVLWIAGARLYVSSLDGPAPKPAAATPTAANPRAAATP